MPHRLHLILDDREHAIFRAQAKAHGLSLVEWLRVAGRAQVERSRPARITTVDDLRSFFAEQDAREIGREPDWEEHLAVLDRSRRVTFDAT